MQKIVGRLTVFFENPFWVGVYERVSDGQLEACKITFGSEPKDYRVYEFLMENWHHLRFSPPVSKGMEPESKPNPKRMQRAIQKQLDTRGVGTKSQEALKLQHEEGKAARKKKNREQRDAEAQRQYDLHEQKRKERHRGR